MSVPRRITASMLRTLDALADIERGTLGRADIAFRPHKPHPIACKSLEALGLFAWDVTRSPPEGPRPRLTPTGCLVLEAYRLGRRRGTRYAR